MLSGDFHIFQVIVRIYNFGGACGDIADRTRSGGEIQYEKQNNAIIPPISAISAFRGFSWPS